MNILEDVVGSKTECPSCGRNFIGEDIYEYFLRKYKDPKQALEDASLYGWSEDKPRNFKKDVGLETSQYDGVSWYYCTKCSATWKRFEWSDPRYLLESRDYDYLTRESL